MEPNKPAEPKQSPIMDEAETQRKPVFDPTGRVEQINAGEIKIADIRRHPFGLVLIYIQVLLALALAFGLILPFAGDGFESLGFSRASAASLMAVLSIMAFIFIILYLFLATRIYKTNQLILTNDNVTHVAQVSLFHRKISEISMANVEDVTAHQTGLFSTIFNFGRLHIETAGEQNNLDFIYCPNPNAYAKAIQDARVEFIKVHGD
jgi:uncharacterized membrane protein YdbT with pleckstrin-like domain